MRLDMVNREIEPSQRLPTMRTAFPVIGVPQESPLLNRETPLIVPFLEQPAEDLPQYLRSPLPCG